MLKFITAPAIFLLLGFAFMFLVCRFSASRWSPFGGFIAPVLIFPHEPLLGSLEFIAYGLGLLGTWLIFRRRWPTQKEY